MKDILLKIINSFMMKCPTAIVDLTINLKSVRFDEEVRTSNLSVVINYLNNLETPIESYNITFKVKQGTVDGMYDINWKSVSYIFHGSENNHMIEMSILGSKTMLDYLSRDLGYIDDLDEEKFIQTTKYDMNNLSEVMNYMIAVENLNWVSSMKMTETIQNGKHLFIENDLEID